MLTALRIENFAIVSTLELDFAAGMTAFTGETGAGKSIMIDALMLALGARSDASVVRVGADKCDIQATFSFDPHTPPAEWLFNHDVAYQDGEIVLRRIIYAEGRSKSSINGVLFPLQKIKELSEMLVDIHGQHQHQTLMQHATHRQQLDQYAGHNDLLAEVQNCYHQCLQIKTKLTHLSSQELAHERMALLEFQLNDLTNLNIQPGEIESLHQEHQLLHHARDYLVDTQHINELLNTDDQPNIRQNLNAVLHCLSKLPQEHPNIKNASELMNSALIQCDEALDEMEKFATQVQLDPERLQIVEARMSELHQAARKYHVDVNQLFEHHTHLENELSHLQNSDQEKIQLQQEYEKQSAAYQVAALALRESRLKHAIRLEKEITKTIRELGMPKGFIKVELTPLEKMHHHGLDKVEYKVCTNPGMLPDTLSKIASGGELSRISLGIQMIAAQRGSTPTLLFDEVDVGIGGATAALVGRLLRELGERLQLFCVTHQPQVASSAHHHFRVEKYTKNEQTFSSIYFLTEDEKVEEIARMLGGLTVTEQTRSHARELLNQQHLLA